MPGDPRRTNQAMPAMAPPPMPGDPRRSSSGMPAVTPPPPEAMRASSSAMPAVTTPMLNSAQGSSPNPATNQEHSNAAFGDPAPPKMIYAPGTVIAGKYRLERVLGQGGMGAVWVVRNLSLDADFALKLIRRDRATEEAAARLLTEARAAAAVLQSRPVSVGETLGAG
jgi:serine/threonine-protein kinase